MHTSTVCTVIQSRMQTIISMIGHCRKLQEVCKLKA